MLLGQNLPQRLPNTNSVRVLVATWLVWALVLGSAYRGNLTANLTLPKYPPRPETIPQLVDTVDRTGREVNASATRRESVCHTAELTASRTEYRQ
ncbi:hypothetical protein Pcinc_009780 [Petrolisthes cinctipes]|uniref:Ionotropic glutamate receptor C-terminal domain-containing protein n=1 Tax=Petrolisthes cinctipes TaxID=88211 RepID=A0AAE1G4C0_PETCI|nr:hypothetical protein Pcinc_009780 [Petrolisthes cinctipes]